MSNARSFKYLPILVQDEESEKDFIHRPKRIIPANLLKFTCLLIVALPYAHILWPKEHSVLVVIENDEMFLTTDPFVNDSEDQLNPPWDELYVGSWVAIEYPSIVGTPPPGMRMNEVAAEPHKWAEESEGYGVAVMHQIHCIMTIKHALYDLSCVMPILHSNTPKTEEVRRVFQVGVTLTFAATGPALFNPFGIEQLNVLLKVGLGQRHPAQERLIIASMGEGQQAVGKAVYAVLSVEPQPQNAYLRKHFKVMEL
ncbi:hypothetical protein GLAREA_06510 [Glarea lozoyensis ATCC 20868]|uniref:Uncharacterized protein n=1 Tax=Glarea lozoyensis (strain ATCC 20868 / MF5171) TaxID=1116229 RepID=S3D4W6_GLAL2|nr:uncharacterized protein GLAREA_06510 [Glarea lozoyensis ATCC 20868]EPE33497.1 hypothetical protein GLAREA_06510 [Glarea lozoyensis ATCC 20868]